MGDSDDEYDRKRRDKFRGERDSYRSDRRDDRSKGREDPYDRPRSNRGPPSDYRDSYGRSQRERNYSPDRGPPMKRTRHDWDDRPPRYVPRIPGGGHEPYGMYGGGYGHHDPYYSPMGFHGPPPGLPRDSAPAAGDTPTQPAMLTLKQFLGTQDDSISDQDAITKYNEYKVDFKRQQLNEFFVAHKDEEWFKIKYHPEESLKRREEQLEYLKNRINVFSELLDSGDIQKTNVDMPNSEQIIRLLDTVVIKLEGGTEEDLKVLDHKPEPPKPIEVTPKKDVEKAESVEKTEESEKKDEDVEMKEPEAPAKEEKRREKRKRSRSSGSSGSSSSSSSSSSDTSEDEAPKSPPKEEEPKEEVEKEKEEEPKEEVEEGEKTENGEEKDEEGEEKPEGEEKEEGEGEEKAEKSEGEGETEEVEKPETIDVDQPKEVIRELHRTSSIFLRNLAPTITKAEVEAMCKRYSGFLRVAIADPLVERRWFRRGWVTFQREVNIKEICWNLNNIRLRDCELGAIVNRDLSRRVRPVNGITVHRSIIRSDIKLAAKIAHNLDVKANLWVEGEDAEGGTEKNGSSKFGFNTKNPVLSNITDYLIEEASAEEEELLGLSKEDGKEGTEGEPIERDPDLILVLDKIILYLRIVHSVDFYNHCEYPYEDEMPNRCGIIHARGPVPQNNVTQTEIQEWIRNFEKKISSSLLAKSDEELKEEELKKLGCKDQDEEVEKFIKANTQELGKDKWLCPLSGKKFKGPDFIRKHIFNKHSEKVEEVRKEVSYFNNYLKDSKRPQLPEHPANTRKTDNPAPAQPQYRPPPYGGMPYGGMPYGGFPMIGRSRGGFRGRGPPPAVDYRPVIHYRDLDAPREPEEF